MEDRLKLVDYLNKHPEVRDVEIKPPIFAVGFPSDSPLITPVLSCFCIVLFTLNVNEDHSDC